MITDSLEKLNEEIVSCRICARLVKYREEIAQVKRKAYMDHEYWGRPVPGFGDPKARVLVVGLAPGAHGSNRTGRQFTGDASGRFLYPALHRAGFASQPKSENRSDGLRLHDLYITASARCAPPANKPSPEELNNCQPYLEREIELVKPKVIVVLGRVAFERVLKIVSRSHTAHGRPQRMVNRPSSIVFSHGAFYKLDGGPWLLCSYHPSQQNTSTGKLTAAMFDEIWKTARTLMESSK